MLLGDIPLQEVKSGIILRTHSYMYQIINFMGDELLMLYVFLNSVARNLLHLQNCDNCTMHSFVDRAGEKRVQGSVGR